MNSGKTIFSQLVSFLPDYEFQKCVLHYHGNFKAKSFSCWNQFLAMAFAQLTFRESLRDIESCLRANHRRLYHMGLRGKVSRNTLAHANETRNWRIFADFAQVLIREARELYAQESLAAELDQTIYALDSTTLDLCLSLFPWALFRKAKGAVKMHTLLDLRANIPTFLRVTPGRVHDVNMLDEIPLEPGSFYVMDRGYLDFARLHRFTQAMSFFVIRAKKNLCFRRLYSRPVDKTVGLRCDQTIVLKGIRARNRYPSHLRRVNYFDSAKGKRLSFLTNNFTLPAVTIAQLYRCRWQIELFFKWIKQHLRIKAFYGTSENAVKAQIWIAVSVYVLVAIVKKRLALPHSLYTILQVLSVSLFEKISMQEAFANPIIKDQEEPTPNQLLLFNL